MIVLANHKVGFNTIAFPKVEYVTPYGTVSPQQLQENLCLQSPSQVRSRHGIYTTVHQRHIYRIHLFVSHP